MISKPLVTILSPCYNVGQFLPICLDSIVGQTYTNLQIVLIDDGSKDHSWQIMQEYAVRDSRIEIYHQENQGVATTRNHLLEKIKGDYVLFVDSDDWVELDMVAFLVSKIQENEADVAICADVINDAPVSSIYEEVILSQAEVMEKFLFHKELRGSLWNKLVKANLLHKLTFNSRISYGEDALFCWHFFQRANKVIWTNRELYHYRMNENSLCHSTFGPKKLSGHYVWSQICKETQLWWPQFLTIAQARHCVEDILLLRDAAHCGYKQKDDVEMLQKNIKELRHTLYKVNITTAKMKWYSLFASHSYWFASKF